MRLRYEFPEPIRGLQFPLNVILLLYPVDTKSSSLGPQFVEDRVRITSAALADLNALLPRRDSRAVVLRHLRKLKLWKSGNTTVLDVEVTDFDDSEIKELCLTNSFGFYHGLRVAFFEDVLSSPAGVLWIVGFRRGDELLTAQKLRIYSARRSLKQLFR